MGETLVVAPVGESYVKENQHLSLNPSTKSALDVEEKRPVGETLVVTPVRDVEESVLSVLGKPIPPSRVAAIAKANRIPYPDAGAGPKSIQRYECATWEYLRQVIDQLVENANLTNLKSTAAQLYAENIVRGRGFFAAACMRCQSKNPHLTLVYAGLAGFVNNYCHMVGDLLYRRLYLHFFQMLTHEVPFDQESMSATIKFLSCLINLGIVYTKDAIKILLRCLDEVTEERVKSAVTFFKELKFPADFAPVFIVVRERFEMIIEAEKLKKEVRDMVQNVIAEQSWNYVFNDYAIASSELQLVIPELRIHSPHSISKKPLTNRDIFLDEYKPDRDFLKRERAYYLFRSNILHKGYWAAISFEEEKYFSDLAENPGIDHRFLCDTLLPIIKDEDHLCLSIVRYWILGRAPLSHLVLIEVLCKDNKRYTEALETCFLAMWLMVSVTVGFSLKTSDFFAELLHRGILSWDFVAHLSYEPQDMTRLQYGFLCNFFEFYGEEYGFHSISENLLRHNCLCVPAAITFFRNKDLRRVAADLERLWKARNGTMDRVAAGSERLWIDPAKGKKFTIDKVAANLKRGRIDKVVSNLKRGVMEKAKMCTKGTKKKSKAK